MDPKRMADIKERASNIFHTPNRGDMLEIIQRNEELEKELENLKHLGPCYCCVEDGCRDGCRCKEEDNG